MDVKLKSRRQFIKLAGIAGIGLGAAACAVAAPPAPTATPAHDDQNAAAAAPEPSATPVDMDAMHEAGIKKYLDNIGKDTKFFGNKLEPKIVDGVKEFNITCSDIQWDAGGGAMADAMAYNGSVPGPEIRVVEGDKPGQRCLGVKPECRPEVHQVEREIAQHEALDVGREPVEARFVLVGG